MQLLIEKTVNTPLIEFEKGVLSISGRSIPENSLSFFEPVFKFIADYTKNPHSQTTVNIMLEYANSSTNRSLMTIFTLLEKLHEDGNAICINWYYETDDDLMAELANDFKSLIHMPFNIHERNSFN
jgi:hypothetical protein